MSASSRILIVVALIFTCVSGNIFAQKSKKQLEREKKASLKKIKQAERILSQTKSKKENSIGQLYALNAQISERKKIINAVKQELTLIDTDIADNNDIIESLNNDLKNLKEEYAKMIYATQKATLSQSKLIFIFSSKTFNELFMRLKYMEQYSDTRKKQSEQINKVKNSLGTQVTVLKNKKKEKNSLLNEQVAESYKLTKLQKNQSSLINNLAKTEKKAKKEIEKNKRAVAKLNSLINKLITTEIAKANKVKSTKSKSKAKALAKSFNSNKGKLPWPVESGFVSKKYGRQQHPVWKHVTIENKGIDIQTETNQKVRTVFDGEVKKIAFVPGMGNMVMVQHGDYFTVYAKLKEVVVRSGQTVATRDELGTVLTNADGVAEVKFSVWKNNQTMNPNKWLNPR